MTYFLYMCKRHSCSS